MGDRDFTALMSAADPAMIVVTTAVEGEPAGCLVGFHAQSSISPAHYAVRLSKANHTYRVGLRASHFALHFLSAHDVALAELFGTRSGEDTEKFSGLDVDLGVAGVPLLGACPHRLLLERITLLDDGGEPLRLSAVAHLRAGHDSAERVIRP